MHFIQNFLKMNFPSLILTYNYFPTDNQNCTLVSIWILLNQWRLVDNNLSLFHINIRNCRKNFSLLELFLKSIIISLSIIILTEISCDFLCELKEYRSYVVYRTTHGGGIKIYIRDSLSAMIINEMSFVNELYECLFCELSTPSKKYTINCIYRPPHTSMSRFMEHFWYNILTKLPINCNSILCGDFNINLFNPLIIKNI